MLSDAKHLRGDAFSGIFDHFDQPGDVIAVHESVIHVGRKGHHEPTFAHYVSDGRDSSQSNFDFSDRITIFQFTSFR